MRTPLLIRHRQSLSYQNGHWPSRSAAAIHRRTTSITEPLRALRGSDYSRMRDRNCTAIGRGLKRGCSYLRHRQAVNT